MGKRPTKRRKIHPSLITDPDERRYEVALQAWEMCFEARSLIKDAATLLNAEGEVDCNYSPDEIYDFLDEWMAEVFNKEDIFLVQPTIPPAVKASLG